MTQEPEENASHSEGQEPSALPNPDDPTQEHASVPEEQPIVPVHPSSSDHATDPKREAEEEGGPVKSFLEHLEDLRWTIIKSGSSLIVAMVVCLCATKQIVAVLTWPMIRAGLDPSKILQLFNPLGGFLISLKMAFYTGLVIALPFILYFLGEFVVPALKKKEKKFFFVAFTIGTGFFVVGVVFCYFILLPFSLTALVNYNKWIGFSTETWRAEEFFDFATKFMLGVGFLFEVPVLLLSLIRLEIIKHEMLVKGRTYMFVVNFALCAVLTPADLVTTFMMAVALQLIYEGCILISKYWQRQKRQRLETEAGLRTPGSDPPTSMD